jgi:archaetidylinositol phosphate synthase
MMGRRIHTGVLNSLEAALIGYLLPKVPRSITPNQLSAFAASGAVAAGLGLGACQFSPWFLTVVLLGLFANWLGDSFDGAVARRNKAERPRGGFLIDRCCDVLSFCAIILGLGLSPYLSLHLALMLLVGYLVNTIYGLMKLVVDGVHIIGVGGIGATEGRVIIGLWAVLIQILHVNLQTFPIGNIPLFDVICAASLATMFVIFARRVGRDIARVNYLDRPWTQTGEKFAAKAKIVPFAGRRLNFDRHMNIDGESAKGVGAEIKSPDKSF